MMAPQQMGFSRTALIEKLMKEDPVDDSSEKVPIDEERLYPRKRIWDNIQTFIDDNLNEVESKLSLIETQIWGKIIIMEKNFRTAKAYLRNSTILIDGSIDEFDGIKLGLSNFNNEMRDSTIELELKLFNKGIKIHLDDAGNIWMKKNGLFDRCITVKTKQKKDMIILTDNYQKIFDLRRFKESILLDISSGLSRIGDGSGIENLNKKRLKESTMIYIKLTDTLNDNYLNIPIWCSLVHLIAFDMVNIIANEFGYQSINSFKQQLLSIPVSSSLSQLNILSSNSSNSSSGNEDSSVSSSSYQLSSSSCNRNQKSGVAKRIFQQRKPQQLPPSTSSSSTTNHYSKPLINNNDDRHKQRPRSKSQTRSSVTTSSIPSMITFKPRQLSPPRLLSQTTNNGWSLLNLSDIDKLKTPAYFTSREEAGSRRYPVSSEIIVEKKSKKTKKSRSKSRNSREPQSIELQKYKWLSETCLKNL